MVIDYSKLSQADLLKLINEKSSQIVDMQRRFDNRELKGHQAALTLQNLKKERHFIKAHLNKITLAYFNEGFDDEDG